MAVDAEGTKLDAGRHAIGNRLRALADGIDTLPLDGAAEALSWIGDDVERVLREADWIVRAQAGRQLPCQQDPASARYAFSDDGNQRGESLHS